MKPQKPFSPRFPKEKPRQKTLDERSSLRPFPKEGQGKGMPGKKRSLNPPGTMLFPVPVVMVTCQGNDGKPNIITVAWTGVVCSDPPMVSISVRPERHSFRLLQETGEFVINIPSAKEAYWTDKLGVLSGKNVDKIEMSGFTLGPCEKISVPLINDCPVNLECRVTQSMSLGTHTLFLARIENVQVSEECIDKKGRVAIEKMGLVAFAHGFYYRLGKQIGHFGFSVRRKTTAKEGQHRSGHK